MRRYDPACGCQKNLDKAVPLQVSVGLLNHGDIAFILISRIRVCRTYPISLYRTVLRVTRHSNISRIRVASRGKYSLVVICLEKEGAVQ